MSVHLVNPSDNSFGTAVITPRWLFVLAAATPRSMGDPILVDESLEQLDVRTIQAGDVVGISVHTGNALRGYAVGRLAHERGATVVYGGIHATLFPEEPFERGAADVVVKGDGDLAWGNVLRDLERGCAKRIYDGGKIEGEEFLCGALGPDADRQVHVGVSADNSRMSEALFVLFGVANRWAEAPPADIRESDRRNCRPQAKRFSVYCPCR